MKPENFTERKKGFLKFGLLYAGSLAALAAVFFFLPNGQPDPALPSADTDLRSSSGADASSANGTVSYNVSAARKVDSILHELMLVRNKLLQRDSLIAVLSSQPATQIDPRAMARIVKDDPTTGLELERLEKENVSDEQALMQLQDEKTSIQQKLDATQKEAGTLADQLAVLRQTNETLETKVNEAADHAAAPDNSAASADQATADTRHNALMAKNAALERRSAELSDQLRFAEVDCNLSRADARKIVYNARQRQNLLTDALTSLNQLSRSSDPDVQKKAKEKLAVLRNLAAMIHD